jgi:hypothetical protein
MLPEVVQTSHFNMQWDTKTLTWSGTCGLVKLCNFTSSVLETSPAMTFKRNVNLYMNIFSLRTSILFTQTIGSAGKNLQSRSHTVRYPKALPLRRMFPVRLCARYGQNTNEWKPTTWHGKEQVSPNTQIVMYSAPWGPVEISPQFQASVISTYAVSHDRCFKSTHKTPS